MIDIIYQFPDRDKKAIMNKLNQIGIYEVNISERKRQNMSTVSFRNLGEITTMTYNPEKDQIFCMICRNCYRYSESLTWNQSTSILNKFQALGCVCGAHTQFSRILSYQLEKLKNDFKDMISFRKYPLSIWSKISENLVISCPPLQKKTGTLGFR